MTESQAQFYPRLEAAEQEALLALARRRLYGRHESVFEAGEPPREVFILLRGQVKVFKALASGKEVILWFCRPGELFGLADMVAGGRRRVHARSCMDSELLIIGEEAFRRFLQGHPNAAVRFVDLLSGRMRLLIDVLGGLVEEDVTQRVISLLARLSVHYGRPADDGLHLDIALTHQDIADMVGTSRQSVTTALCELKRRQVLSTPRRRIVVHRRELLEEVLRGGG